MKKNQDKRNALHAPPPMDKLEQLGTYSSDIDSSILTTNQGVKISDHQNSLKSGARGSTLLEDFMMREKIMHFDHERIPERVVHARGEAAHGYFQVYQTMQEYTKAQFLQDPSAKTPVFVRFSTVVGSRGSADTVRDVRGFAVKFYTQDGNFDLVGNNIPVFFIQDAIKFPDLIHAVKPEPNNEMPQATTAHDTFWDFISLMPESMHMVMWIMSDRAIPRSLRMMEGFGVHTFRWINQHGISHFVKFHWKPLLGVHSLAWDEAQLLTGLDPDYHRRDLWEAIENGAYPEWELAVQLIPEADEHQFDFDLLDATKLIPEELAPLQRIGKLTLNRNPDNFFAETEQVAFHPGNLVPGIDFSNDPLLQGRLFSYTDTQLSRLGGANFHEIPINRPICPFHNMQRDGMHQQLIHRGRISYEPNSLAPTASHESTDGFSSYVEPESGHKIRQRSESFADHFSQAMLFWNSQSVIEQEHIVNAFQFELAKVKMVTVRTRVIGLLANIHTELAERVAQKFSLSLPSVCGRDFPPCTLKAANSKRVTSPALSMQNTIKNTIKTRQIAILVTKESAPAIVRQVKNRLLEQGAFVRIVASAFAQVTFNENEKTEFAIDALILTAPSVLFDAVVLVSSAADTSLLDRAAFKFLEEAYCHYKTVAVIGSATVLSRALSIYHCLENNPPGILYVDDQIDAGINQFIELVKLHRHWERQID